MTDETLNYIFRRRSMRIFLQQPVEEEKLELLLMAAMAAPTATNSQPWEFVVVTEEERLAGLRSIAPFGKFYAPAAIVVCGSMRVAANPSGRMFWVQDCSAATQNILLGAVELGLGACWIGIHPIPLIGPAVAKHLKLPRGVQPLNLIYIGYPEHPKNPRTQYLPERVHWQEYGHRKDNEA